MIKALIRKAVRSFGYDVIRYSPPPKNLCDSPTFADLSEADKSILRKIEGISMTSIERQIALIQAVRYISTRDVHGSIVECGVYRGGSCMAIALSLRQCGDCSRDLYLFDTFAGMSTPTEHDRSYDGMSAQQHLDLSPDRTSGVWCYAGVDEVRKNMASTGYPEHHVHLRRGRVEDRVTANDPPGPIALLRLDTDWYESTRHELEYLFPRLSVGGVLIIDDYGHWQGARKAVDDYFRGKNQYLLQRIDYTGRLLIKS